MAQTAMIGPDRIIPASRKGVRWWQLPFWALFGNDEDGICGERGGPEGYRDRPVTWWNFLRWWTRNPLHNLTHHVLAIPFDGPGRFWAASYGWLMSCNGGPLIAYRGTHREGYVGFRPWEIGGRWVGVLGIAWRRR